MRIQNYPKEYNCMATEKKNKLVSLVRIMQGTKGAWLAKKKKNN